TDGWIPGTSPDMTTHSPREWLQLGLDVGGQCGAGNIQDHGVEAVVAVYGGQVDDALLAELLQRTLVGGVADALVGVQLAAEVEHDLLVRRHACGPPAVGDSLRNLRLETCLLGQRAMRLPFVVLPPLARCDEDGQL